MQRQISNLIGRKIRCLISISGQALMEEHNEKIIRKINDRAGKRIGLNKGKKSVLWKYSIESCNYKRSAETNCLAF